jgi:hypothetical protein
VNNIARDKKTQTACIQRYRAYNKEAWENNLMGEARNELLNVPNALRSPRVVGI